MVCRQVELFWNTLMLWWRLARGLLGCPWMPKADTSNFHHRSPAFVYLLYLCGSTLIMSLFVRMQSGYTMLHPVFVRPRGGSEKRWKTSISLPENEAHDGVHLLPDLLVGGSGEAFQQGRLFFRLMRCRIVAQNWRFSHYKKIEIYLSDLYRFINMIINNMYIGQSLGNCPV